MFIKNLQFAFRNFKKHKATTAINILGLAVGISASVVIFLIVRYDYSFDKWEPQQQNIYRVITKLGGFGINTGVSVSSPKTIKEKVPAIKTMARFIQSPFENLTASIPQAGKPIPQTFKDVKDMIFADENYFKIFPHQWLAGNAQSLSQLNSTVLSLSLARKFFPHTSPDKIIGKTIIFNDSINTVVSGVVADLKYNSDFDNKIFVSLNTFTDTNIRTAIKDSWTAISDQSQCFFVLQAGADTAKINAQIKKLYVDHQQGWVPSQMFIGQLQSLDNIHFDRNVNGKASRAILRNLSLLALFLLLLGAINFINLSTAQSTLRAKEIGVRKTFGSSKKQIICQFLTETFLITFYATATAVLFSPLLMYIFKGFIPEGLDIKEMLQPSIILFITSVWLLVTFLAGLYPAFVLSKYRPVTVLKKQAATKGKSNSVTVREFLTVFQFVIAQVFLIAVIVIGKQIHFELNKDLGFRKDAIISFLIPDVSYKGMEQPVQRESRKDVLLNKLKQIPQVQNISLSKGAPTENSWSMTMLNFSYKGKEMSFNTVHEKTVDSNYIKLFNIQLLAGKNVQIDTNSKEADILINETFLHQMGVQAPEDVIGLTIQNSNYKIVGVVKDFTTRFLHDPISPAIIIADNNNSAYKMSVALPLDPSTWGPVLQKIEKTYKSVYPSNEFNYDFLDDTIKGLYENDMRLSTLLKWATGLAIFISCLGLLGLVSFMTNQRTKEIGIRKVLGASVSQIITLLSKSLIKLVVIASVIAFPVAWYFSHKWLQDFAFKTALSWWIFIISAIGMLLIALMVLCLRTFKAARANPVESLRDE